MPNFLATKTFVENLSIPFQQYIFNSKIQIIDIELDDGTRVSRIPSILSMDKPIESLFFSPRHKCFTFFSQLQSSSSSSRRVKVIMKKISIVIYSGWQTIPYSNQNTVYLAIHSPNIMPNIDSFIPINITSRIDLVYTKFQFDQLPSYSGCNSLFRKYQSLQVSEWLYIWMSEKVLHFRLYSRVLLRPIPISY